MSQIVFSIKMNCQVFKYAFQNVIVPVANILFLITLDIGKLFLQLSGVLLGT